jgi:hypothetical protein
MVDADRCVPIPAWLNTKLVESADHYASELAPKLRRLLAQPSFVSGLETFGNTLTGKELVHTSYFDHAEILDLLVLHMAWTGLEVEWLPLSRTKNPLLVKWFTDAKWRAMGKGELADLPPRFDTPSAHPSTAARRTVCEQGAPCRKTA